MLTSRSPKNNKVWFGVAESRTGFVRKAMLIMMRVLVEDSWYGYFRFESRSTA